MIPLTFESSKRQSRVIIQPGLIGRLGLVCQEVVSSGSRCLVVTDSNVAGHYLEAVVQALQVYGFQVSSCVLPAGEESKTLAAAETIYTAAMQAKLTRKDAFIALGGGVVGDLVGFCASTYHRGTPVIQIPTTLIAQVDSAIGGKTAVNFGQVKNVVGTFYQPVMVLVDPDVLKTLPEREYRAGLAEVVKYSLIETSCTGRHGFFDWLLQHADNLKAVLPQVIERCCQIKATVVTQDETETRGLRFYLNLGHTFGHAYESLSGFELVHGEAVAIGLVQAIRTALVRQQFPLIQGQAAIQLLHQLGFKAILKQAAQFPVDELLACMRQDKKNESAQIKLVLPEKAPGCVVLCDDVPDELLREVLVTSE